jgi:hypothetical protein
MKAQLAKSKVGTSTMRTSVINLQCRRLQEGFAVVGVSVMVTLHYA